MVEESVEKSYVAFSFKELYNEKLKIDSLIVTAQDLDRNLYTTWSIHELENLINYIEERLEVREVTILSIIPIKPSLPCEMNKPIFNLK